MIETKENDHSVPKMMEGEKPSLKEQIAYMKTCLEESKKDLKEVTDQATNEPEFTEHAARMQELVIMLESIQENLLTVRIFEMAMKAQKLCIDGASKIAKERSEHFSKHNRTIESDAKENQSGQLIEGAMTLLQKKFKHNRQVIAPEGWDQEIFERMASKPYEERLIIVGSLVAAEYDRVQFGSEPSEGKEASHE